MRYLFWLLITLLAVSPAEAWSGDEEVLPLTILNDSDFNIVVAVQTPSLDAELLIEVPMQSVVYNIPIPAVEDDQVAIAYAAHATSKGLQRDAPLNMVGLVKLLRRQHSRHANSTLPVLWYQGPRDQTITSSNADDRHVFISPLTIEEARRWIDDAMARPRRIDYQKLRSQTDRNDKP
jgi:hypothetical protein